MSATSTTSPISPIERRDIRSAAQPFKRDKDHGEKWSNGTRPAAGVRTIFFTDELVGGSETQREKVRPMKQWSQMYAPPWYLPQDIPTPFPEIDELIDWYNRGGEHKSHANKTAKPTSHATYQFGASSGRLDRKVDAILDVNDHTNSPLSKSLLELLPQHANNANPSIQTLVRESNDAGVLYSYDSNIASPGVRGREVDLGGLVEMAEKKWVSEQTDRIVKGEYEVLDKEGETTMLSTGKGKKRGSPKQKAVKNMPAVVKNVEAEEDDGFELV